MSDGARIAWGIAYEMAMGFKQAYITEVTCLATVAGSIRRCKPEVGDIEIVCIPRYETRRVETKQASLFETATVKDVRVNLLAERLRELVEQDIVTEVKGLSNDDPKYVQVIWEGINVDVFSATYENWGYQLVLRTGPGDANHWMVTGEPHGGKPSGVELRDGYVWVDGERVAVPSEERFYEIMGIGFLKPRERTVENYKRAKVRV